VDVARVCCMNGWQFDLPDGLVSIRSGESQAGMVFFSESSSNSIGVRYPSAEWRRRRLWKISMYSKIALAISIRVFHFVRLSSSICIDDQTDSNVALSRPSPTLPKDGMSPAEGILLPKDQDVN
jgi:hypothetical protein